MRVVIALVLVLVVVTGENKVNSYSNQLKLKLGLQVGVEIDKNKCSPKRDYHVINHVNISALIILPIDLLWYSVFI